MTWQQSGTARAGFDILRGLGPRLDRRPTPRAGTLLSVVGALICLVGVIGALGVAEAPLALVIVVFLGLTCGGYFLVWKFMSGPLAAAGAAASGLALPMLLSSALTPDGDASTGALVAVGILSIAGWIAAYVVGPGRGHVVYVGLALVGLAVALVTLLGGGSTFDDGSDAGYGAVWALLMLAALYLTAGYFLDRQKLAGLATAFVGVGNVLALLAALFALAAAGVDAAGDVLESSTSSRSRSSSSSDSYAQLILPGLILGGGGLLMIRYAVSALRRGTAWTGAACSVIGVFFLVFGLFGENGTAVVIVMLMIGAAAVYAGYWMTQRIGEADEMAEAPSFVNVGLLDALKTGQSVRSEDPAIWRTFGGTPWVGEGVPWAQPAQTTPPPAAPAPYAPAAPTPPPVAPHAPVAPTPPPGAPQAPAFTPPPTTPQPAVQPTPAAAPPPPRPDGSPAPGWWLASDGNWYPPEQQPGY